MLTYIYKCQRAVYAVVLSIVMMLPAASCSFAQPNHEMYKDYLLYSEFGEFCTMCEAILLCEERQVPIAQQRIPDNTNFILVYLQTRTFWSQIATIWEWFIYLFDPLDGHNRPVQIYAVQQGQWAEAVETQAHISAVAATIAIGDWRIDRKSGQWRVQSSGQSLGYCQRLPLWESLARIELETLKDADE